MAILEPVVSVRAAVVCEIVAGSFDSFVETTALYVVPGVVRAIPVIPILSQGSGNGGRCAYTRRGEQ